MLFLVVTTPFKSYRRGTIISDLPTIDTIRASEYASSTVLVSDTVIMPPQPPPDLSVDDLRGAYYELTQANAVTQTALSAILSTNLQQTQSLVGQEQRLTELTAAVNDLAARVNNPNQQPPIPPNLADDKPLAEDDGFVLATDGGSILAGDIR